MSDCVTVDIFRIKSDPSVFLKIKLKDNNYVKFHKVLGTTLWGVQQCGGISKT